MSDNPKSNTFGKIIRIIEKKGDEENHQLISIVNALNDILEAVDNIYSRLEFEDKGDIKVQKLFHLSKEDIQQKRFPSLSYSLYPRDIDYDIDLENRNFSDQDWEIVNIHEANESKRKKKAKNK
jgi:hypothetical protein